MKRRLAVLMAVIGFATIAQAGILIEPFLGYRYGTLNKQTVSSSTEYTDTLDGIDYGLRLGYKFLMPWVALEYELNSGVGKNGIPSASGGADYNYKTSAVAAVFGIDLPVMFRFWAGYGIQSNMTIIGNGSSVDNKFKGTHAKIGVGYKGLPLVSLNLEYIMNQYTKHDAGAGAGDVGIDTNYKTFNYNTLVASVSVPFNL